jgi:hypothetical protein
MIDFTGTYTDEYELTMASKVQRAGWGWTYPLGVLSGRGALARQLAAPLHGWWGRRDYGENWATAL